MGVKVRSSDLRKTILALEDKLADTPKELEAYEDLEDLIKLWKSFLEETKLKEDRPPKPKKEKKTWKCNKCHNITKIAMRKECMNCKALDEVVTID